jgi:hypothetical protein
MLRTIKKFLNRKNWRRVRIRKRDIKVIQVITKIMTFKYSVNVKKCAESV